MWQMHYIIRVKFNQSYADEVFKIYERVAILVFYLYNLPHYLFNFFRIPK
ncbi:hypothetical protein CAMGR0001_2392 [Campylobacter gracilis RM3268]|uniref:Uncharacterized protein n=1 Tax=Campylobacter gracilis RM3268 TaxID=553220 RepID=C8PE42_9BACT|nr:hypothetical protein CAMGR0001_2392 [Campylobacter gracilis RM3268]